MKKRFSVVCAALLLLVAQLCATMTVHIEDLFLPEDVQPYRFEENPQLNSVGKKVYTATFDATKQKQLETTISVKLS